MINQKNDKFILIIYLIIVVAFIVTPLFFMFGKVFTPNSSYLNVLISEKIIYSYIFNTLELILKVGIIASIIGFGFACIVTFFDFPFKKVFTILLTLPLSIPVYVGAYTYSGIYFDRPVIEMLLKNDFTMNGSVFIYAIFLYPYVYLASRSYLKNHMAHLIDVSQTLKKKPVTTFFKIVLPMSRPVIIGSVMFVLFETLSDFAVVNFYGVQTLSKAISDSWLGLGQIETASKIAVIFLFVIVFLIYSEKLSRGNRKYSTNIKKPIKPRKANKLQMVLIYLPMIVVLYLGLYLPISEMISYAIQKSEFIIKMNIISLTVNTLINISIVIFFILIIATLYSSIINNLNIKFKKLFTTIGVIGYSIPSLILGIGAYIAYINIDKILFNNFGFAGIDSYVFTQTRALLIIVLIIKYISVANSNFNSNLEKYDKNLFEASNTLGHNNLSTIRKINFPLLKKSYRFIVLILFIDLIKELTLTYSLRPFNFKTLSTEVYRYAGNEMIEVAAYPSLVIVFISIVFIIFLERGNKNVKAK